MSFSIFRAQGVLTIARRARNTRHAIRPSLRSTISQPLLMFLLAGLMQPSTAVRAQSRDTSAHLPIVQESGTKFVNELLGRMTLEEKIGQMSQVPLNQPSDIPPDVLASRGQVGSFLFITDAAETPAGLRPDSPTAERQESAAAPRGRSAR